MDPRSECGRRYLDVVVRPLGEEFGCVFEDFGGFIFLDRDFFSFVGDFGHVVV